MSLINIIKNLFGSSEAEQTPSNIPEDSMLKRHYLTHLKAQAESNK